MTVLATEVEPRGSKSVKTRLPNPAKHKFSATQISRKWTETKVIDSGRFTVEKCLQYSAPTVSTRRKIMNKKLLTKNLKRKFQEEEYCSNNVNNKITKFEGSSSSSSRKLSSSKPSTSKVRSDLLKFGNIKSMFESISKFQVRTSSAEQHIIFPEAANQKQECSASQSQPKSDFMSR